uniref:Uncharacterized protein n=1 Tax=Zea mays TaxID=4577 RepID=B4FY88_MAIZE|nr:unknown [Zea mays]ACR37065.1 unknown [Zea mays]
MHGYRCCQCPQGVRRGRQASRPSHSTVHRGEDANAGRWPWLVWASSSKDVWEDSRPCCSSEEAAAMICGLPRPRK